LMMDDVEVSQRFVGRVEGEGVAFDALRLGAELIFAGYLPVVLEAALDGFVGVRVANGELKEREIVEICIVRSLLRLMQVRDFSGFCAVAQAFCCSEAVVSGIDGLIRPFEGGEISGDWVWANVVLEME